MLTYEGSIEDVLRSGEYDQGDYVLVKYDELYDLVEQAKYFHDCVKALGTAWGHLVVAMQRHLNRPLHPVLGGKSPYSEFLPL